MFEKLEIAFVMAAMSVFLGAFVAIPIILHGGGDMGTSNPWNTLAMGLILAGNIVLLYRHRIAFRDVLVRGGLVNWFFLLALLSSLWSFDPSITLRRTMTLITSLSFAYYMVARFQPERIIRLLATTTLLLALISIVVSIAVPSIGRSTASHPGAWNGVFPHKNVLGWMTILMATAYIWRFIHEPERRGYCIAALMLCLFVSVMSQSKTALVTTIAVAMLAWGMRSVRMPPLLRAWIFLIVGGFATLLILGVASNYTEVMTAMGRDPSLTGRVPLWALLLKLFMKKPLLGYGYSAFWLDWNPDAQMLWGVVKWTAPEAHNAYIDMLIQLGVVGTLLSVSILVIVIVSSLRAFTNRTVVWADFIFLYSAGLFVSNMTETMLFRAGDIHCALLPICYLAIRMHPQFFEKPVAAPAPVISLKARMEQRIAPKKLATRFSGEFDASSSRRNGVWRRLPDSGSSGARRQPTQQPSAALPLLRDIGRLRDNRSGK